MNRTLFGSTANGMNAPMMPTRPMMPPRIGLPQRNPGSVVQRPGPAMRQPMGGLQAFGMAEGGDVETAWRDYQQPWQRDPESYRNKQLRTHGATVDEVRGWSDPVKDPAGTGNLMRNLRDINSLVRDIAKRRGIRGFASGGRPDMGSIALRDAMLSMPQRAIPDYLLAGFRRGGAVPRYDEGGAISSEDIRRSIERRRGFPGSGLMPGGGLGLRGPRDIDPYWEGAEIESYPHARFGPEYDSDQSDNMRRTMIEAMPRLARETAITGASFAIPALAGARMARLPGTLGQVGRTMTMPMTRRSRDAEAIANALDPIKKRSWAMGVPAGFGLGMLPSSAFPGEEE